jgi:hypothetical protein
MDSAEFQRLSNENVEINRKLSTVIADLEALKASHLSLRGRFYKARAMEEEEESAKEEEEETKTTKGLSIHGGKYL